MRARSLFWIGLVMAAASCVQLLDASHDYQPFCTSENEKNDCDDKNGCTEDSCSPENVCNHAPIDGPSPNPIVGNCQRETCEVGTKKDTPDDTDVPNDNESCTNDLCADGTATNEALADDTPCTLANSPGLCKAGKCTVDCGPGKPACDDMNPCTEDTCNASIGACSFSPLAGLSTPGYTQIVGDCLQQVCLDGVSTAIPDEADLPNDNNICTLDRCTATGMPMYTPANLNAPCKPDGSGICDSNGACLECIDAAQCPPLANPSGCRTRTCTSNKCGESFVPAGTEVPSMQGDCKRTYCDGAGNAVEQTSSTDVFVDNNVCTDDLCVNGTPSNPLRPVNTACGAGALQCNATGQCTGCTTAAECPGSDDFCKTRTCTNMQCGFSYAVAGTNPPTGQTSGDCKILECDGLGHIVTTLDDNDVLIDGNDCTLDMCIAGVPTNELKPANASCNQNGGTVCNGFGMCLEALGSQCADGTECASGFCTDDVCCADTCTGACMACNVIGTQGTCTNVPATVDDAPLCTEMNSCDGMGVCKLDNGQACGMGDDCSSGHCADGVCCDSACTDTCNACNLPGSPGKCTFVPTSTVDPSGTMPCDDMNHRCDGKGACKSTNGTPCTVGTECLSNFCVDGYCCGGICDQLCYSCLGAQTGLTSGACRPILNGTDPQNECPVGNCNGNGSCTGGGGLQANGTSCSNNSACMSGNCVDGVCCDSACTGPCVACSAGKKGQGLDGACGPIKYDTDPDNECTSGSCNGTGACVLTNGQPCTMGTQCLSTYCVDGFCCNSVCNQLCKACSASKSTGSNGTCSFIDIGTDPDNECVGAQICNGAGACN